MTTEEQLGNSRIWIVASTYNKDIVHHLVWQAIRIVAEKKGHVELVKQWDKDTPECILEACDDPDRLTRTERGVRGLVELLRDKSIVEICRVPGAYEIPQAAQLLASRGLCDAVIALGCVIRGETAHFDTIANACTSGLTRVAQDFTIPVGHGVLFVNNKEQAEERTRPPKARGEEAANAVWEMLELSLRIDDFATRNSNK